MKKILTSLSLLLVFFTNAIELTYQNFCPHEKYWQLYDVCDMDQWAQSFDQESHKKMCSYIAEKKYHSILDVPCGPGPVYWGLKKNNIAIDYYGIDITPRIVEFAKKSGVNVKQGSIEQIPYEDNFCDIVYARHILEHLLYYETAINELIRVAKKEVLIIFFIALTDNKDTITFVPGGDAGYYNNCYNKILLEQFVFFHKKVASITWETITNNHNAPEEILHIYLH